MVLNLFFFLNGLSHSKRCAHKDHKRAVKILLYRISPSHIGTRKTTRKIQHERWTWLCVHVFVRSAWFFVFRWTRYIIHIHTLYTYTRIKDHTMYADTKTSCCEFKCLFLCSWFWTIFFSSRTSSLHWLCVFVDAFVVFPPFFLKRLFTFR